MIKMSDDKQLDSLKKVRKGVYGNLEKKKQQSSGIIDCCKEFKFIRKSNTISFNNKMNRIGITHLVLDDKYNQTNVFFDDLVNPIKYGAGSSFGITGHTRSGKSELAELIVLIVKKTNRKYKNREVELYLTWTQPQFYIMLKKLKKGYIMWRDEDPRPTRKGSRTQTWEVENVLHAIAKMENIFIFVDPKKIRVDCDLYFESAGMNRKTRINRFMILDDERYYFGHIYVKLHDDEEFREWYENEKDIFIKDAIKKGGLFPSVDGEEETEIDIDESDYFAELDSIEYVKLCIKESGNELTIKRYSGIIECTETISRRILDNFVKNKKISKKSGPHNIGIYYFRKKRKK